MESLGIILEIVAVVGFLFLVWPHLRDEEWKEKFIHNKAAFSLLIVFVIIFLFVFGIGLFFDTFFPVERLDR
jgi:glucan phosphoethanolaminetransferase (alkaline phosphatase superfamily)